MFSVVSTDFNRVPQIAYCHGFIALLPTDDFRNLNAFTFSTVDYML
jgi:hypothetical protein